MAKKTKRKGIKARVTATAKKPAVVMSKRRTSIKHQTVGKTSGAVTKAAKAPRRRVRSAEAPAAAVPSHNEAQNSPLPFMLWPYPPPLNNDDVDGTHAIGVRKINTLLQALS